MESYDEKSCGAVLIDREGRYLLVENRSGNVGFPKGHVEPGESERETAAREIFEETALKAVFSEGFRMEYGYTLPNGKRKCAVYFLARYETGIPLPAEGEIGYCRLADYGQAHSLLTYDADRKVLEAARKFLTGNIG